MKRDNGVSPIIRPAEQLRELGLRHFFTDGGNFRRGFVQRVFALFVFGDIEKKTRFFEVGAVLRPGVNDAFERRLFFEKRLRFVRVVPEIRSRGDLV